ncbi:hypothetical protein TTHERM_00600620 (macronuclear) [Tetrahymena thermophila SB210]|uniref:Uncharacterized protein n=1 Tax=Tetrahymena thermophila (strain SB210) TaxID=312017 RepID=I7M6A8_TETTS|nr:hypothetical protein TTHERM_00600620 [Tetrahymena thermophila SB210]EAR84870.1 hypothetical protein TTHERM_00600620 [Tetrahymena thermophila SB210]|eukprot:XP_001032533.1 hypothetical protein TTHERM_00600620 [Tetrahymena thermophila SB210]
MNQSQASQLVMDSFDKCNQLLKELIQFGPPSNPFDCCCKILPSKNTQDLTQISKVSIRSTQEIVDDLSQAILDILHRVNSIEQKAQQEVIEANVLIDMMINHNVGNFQQAIYQKKQKYEVEKDKEIIFQLNEQLKKEQCLNAEAGQTLIKMENQYKSMQRKMEIYFKRRIESIQSQIKNIQNSYINKKEVDFQGIFKRLDKLRRRRPWRDHGLDLLLEEDKKNLQLRFVEGGEDGTSTPFSNYSGILTTDYQLPIDSQLEKDLNQGGYLEDLIFNSSSFNHQNYSSSMASQTHKRQTRPNYKSQNQTILRKFYDDIVLAQKNQPDKENKIEIKLSKNNLHVEKSNIQSNPFLLDQSQRPSTILALQSSYNQEILKELDNENDIDEEQNSLNISAKEEILLKAYEIEQIANSFVIIEPKHVVLEDIFKLIDSVDCNLQKTLQESNQLEDILNDISCLEAKNKDYQNEQIGKRRKSKRRQEMEGLNQVQMVNNSCLKNQQLNLSALLEDEIEPLEEVQKKQKMIDNSKFSQFFVDVSEIKANISQSKPSFSQQNSVNTPAHLNYNNIKIDASNLSNLGNFNNYLQNNFIQRGNYVPTQEDEILIIDNSSQAAKQNEGSSNKIHRGSKGTPVSPNLLINGIINGDLACISIYDDRTVKNAAIQQQNLNLNGNENNNNFILPQFDESKISKVFSSANNSFEYNNDSKNNQKRLFAQKTKSSKFKDFSKEFLSNSDILNQSSFKQEKSLNCVSLQQIPDKQLQMDQNDNQNSTNQELNAEQFNLEQSENFIKREIVPIIKMNQQNRIPSPNISFLLGDQINMSEIRKKNNQDDDIQQISTINDGFANNIQILSRDEKLFNDSKNNLSEFLDQFNSNNENHKNNINVQMNCANLAITNGEHQEEAKRHYTNVLDHLSSISDQEFNEQNSLKSPLKETVHLRFDIFDNKQPINFIDLFNCKNDEIEQEFHLEGNQNTISNRSNQEQGKVISITPEQDNEQTTQRQLQSNQISATKLKCSYSVSPSNKQIPLKRFVSVHEKSNSNYDVHEFEKQTSLQNLFTENNSIIKLLKHQIQADMIAAAGFKKEREAEIQKINTPKETQKLTIQKIFSSATSASSPIQQLKKNNSVPFLEDDSQNLAQYQKKQDSSPLKRLIKNNLYFKNGIYSRPTELNYLHKPAELAKSLQSQSPTFEKKIKQDSPQTPNKILPIKLEKDQETQNNCIQYSSIKEQNSSSQKLLENSQNSEQKNSLKYMQKYPSNYEGSYHQYIRKSFNQSSSETKFSEEKQKILHIIQKKLDIAQTREFHPNIQQLNEYKQSKILMGNPFHRRQRNGFNDQQSAISFSQRSSMQSLSNIPITTNQSSCQNLAQPNNQELPLNLKEKLLQNYSESVVEAAKRKLTNSPSRKLLTQMKSYKVKDSPLLQAIQKLKQQSSIEQQN